MITDLMRWLFIALVCAGTAPAQEAVAIRGGTVITGEWRRTLEKHTVLVKGDRITAVVPDGKATLPEGATVVEAAGRWVIPGLFDAHVHLSSTQTPWGTVVEETQKLLDGFLLGGVTSVLDLWSTEEIFDLRELERDGRLTSPRLFVSGPGFCGPTGYGSQFGYRREPLATPADARLAVRLLAMRGVDVIKVALDVVTKDGRRQPSLPSEVFRAIIETAHKSGLKVAAHVLPAPLAADAVEDGIDILAHIFTGKKSSPRLVELIKQRGVSVIPCLVVEEPFLRLRDEPEFLEDPRLVSSVDPRVLGQFRVRGQKRLAGTMFARAARSFPVALENTRALIEAECDVVGGSDASNLAVFHGPGLHREAELLVRAGMGPEDVLRALTSGGARLLGREDEQGTLQVGKLADVVVLDANPLENVRNLRLVRNVIKGGRVIDLDLLRRRVAGTHAEKRGPSALESHFTGVIETGAPPHSELALRRMKEEKRSFLRIEGRVARWPYAFAGVEAHLTPYGLSAVDLTEAPIVEFEVRGTAGSGLFEAITLDSGQGAHQRAFPVTPAWTRMRLDLRRLRSDSIPGNAPLDPARMMTLRFVTGARSSGSFRLDLDDIRFRSAKSKD